MLVRDQLCHFGVAAPDGGGVVLTLQASCEIESQQKATGSGGPRQAIYTLNNY